MRLSAKALIDDLLVSEETCLGAAFCTYTFDPAYFEEHVLRCLLRLRGDPEEDAPRYHDEAVRALQSTPVACFIDASVRQGGRRLPYDLRLVRGRTFHPKVYLVLYESEARAAIGSGNLTKSGLEKNTELFFARRLRYDDADDVVLLRDLDAFLVSCAGLASGGGSQLDLVRSALQRRIAGTSIGESSRRADVSFVSSIGARILASLDAILPAEATIARVGILAPFFEEDDIETSGEAEGLHSALSEVLALRPSAGATLDVGVPWEDAPVSAPAVGSRPSLAGGGAGLWAWRRRESNAEHAPDRVTFLTIKRVGDVRVEGLTSSGAPCRLDRTELELDAEAGRLWRVPVPQVHAPERILRRIAAERTTTLWLHPAAELSPDGRPLRRPLHAKMLLVTTVHRAVVRTYAYVGSANASRGALLRPVGEGGNVEAGVVLRFDGDVGLQDVLPSLVWHSLEGVNLVERPSVCRAPDFSAWIDDVVLDAAAHRLVVSWRDHGPVPLDGWSIRYEKREIGFGVGPSPTPLVVEPFDLDAASAEVVFCAAGGEWTVPIRLEDLTVLPADAAIAKIGLREILALLGGRISSERLSVLVSRGKSDAGTDALEATFGEGFGPTDVFRAWWGSMEELLLSRSVPAFRLCLLGPTGLSTAWRLLRDGAQDLLSPDEVWIYGCELLRELRALALPPGADSEAKAELLRAFVGELVADLERLAPAATERRWLEHVCRFYEIGGGRGNS